MTIAHTDLARALERQELPLPIAFLLSSLIFALTAIVAVLWFQRLHVPISAKPTPIHVALLQLPTPPPPPPVAPPPEALPPPALPVTPTGTVALPPTPASPSPHPKQRPLHRREHLRPLPRVARQASPTPPVTAPIRTAPTPAPVTHPASADPAARESLEGRIKQAIHEASRFPEAAREMGVHGTTLVGFFYRDRAAFSVHVLESSRSTILDRAAVDIVEHADLPPPGKMAGQTLDLEVPIVFDLTTDDD